MSCQDGCVLEGKAWYEGIQKGRTLEYTCLVRIVRKLEDALVFGLQLGI